MIQRIQTVFLLMAVIMVSVNHLLPLFTIHYQVGDFRLLIDFYIMTVKSSVQEMDSGLQLQWVFTSVVHFIFVIGSIFQIFLFKNRKTQLKVGRAMVLMGSIYTIIALIMMLNFKTTLSADVRNFYGMIFPVLGVLFVYLANKYIQKDEDLVRSVDRIR